MNSAKNSAKNSTKNSAKHGFLLLNKKPGLTSYESLSAVKKAFSTGKVGHTGTLDKFASGLLLILVGRGVKLAPLFEKCSKEYNATIVFGAETDTLDPEGEIIAQGPLPSQKEIETALNAFRGEIQQAPPAYSAIHINGQRWHELARQGKKVDMKKRPVTVYELELLSWAPPFARIRTHVSAGTYIRSLARDIALAAGSRAHLSSLERLKLGRFSLENASENLEEGLRPMDKDLFKDLSLPCFYLDEPEAKGFSHGKPLETLLKKDDLCLCSARAAGIFKGDELLGFIFYKNNRWVYGHVFTAN